MGFTCLCPSITMTPTMTLLLSIRVTFLQPSLATITPDGFLSPPYPCQYRNRFHCETKLVLCCLMPPSRHLYFLYPVSCSHTSKIRRVDTHSATVACRLATYVFSVCLPTPCITAFSGNYRQDPSICHIACLHVTCLKKPACATSNR